MKELNKTWIDTWPVDVEYLLKINFDDDDPDFGVAAVPPDVRKKSQLSAIIKAAKKTNHLDIAEAAKDKDADPIKLYGMLQKDDEIQSIPHQKIDDSFMVLV
jgi:hypothetical protein